MYEYVWKGWWPEEARPEYHLRQHHRIVTRKRRTQRKQMFIQIAIRKKWNHRDTVIYRQCYWWCSCVSHFHNLSTWQWNFLCSTFRLIFSHFELTQDHAVDPVIHSLLGKASMKKNVFFRALPELPNPPPPWPQFGQLGPLFSEVEIQVLKVSLELNIARIANAVQVTICLLVSTSVC